MGITFQITDVRRPLISASRLRKKGYDVLLTAQPKLVNRQTGERIPLVEDNGLFVLNIWAPASEVSGFARPGK